MFPTSALINTVRVTSYPSHHVHRSDSPECPCSPTYPNRRLRFRHHLPQLSSHHGAISYPAFYRSPTQNVASQHGRAGVCIFKTPSLIVHQPAFEHRNIKNSPPLPCVCTEPWHRPNSRCACDTNGCKVVTETRSLCCSCYLNRDPVL